MSWRGESFGQPAYFTVPFAPPDRRPAPDRRNGIWAELQVAGEALTALHVGSGVPEPAEETLAAGIPMEPRPGAAADGTLRDGPVLPGSGVKGALRVVFEAVTYSCDPLDRNARCRSRMQACPACALFGMAGSRGALAVSDLTVAGPTGVRHIPQRYSHPDAPRRGRRLYGLTPETGTDDAEETLLVIDPGARLAGALTVRGAEPWAVGVLVLVAGLVTDGLPLVRLGGGKNRGLGAARLQLISSRYASDQRAWMLGDRRTLDDQTLQGWARAAREGDGLLADQLERIREAYRRDA